MGRHYSFSVHTCMCGDTYSGSGRAKWSHFNAHVRRGHAEWDDRRLVWLTKNPPSIQAERKAKKQMEGKNG